MRLRKATIKKFKRFTHLTVQGIPETVRLIVLAGPNGCGKSSFFDALHTWHGWTAQKQRMWEEDYHAKTGSSSRRRWRNDVEIEFHDSLPANPKKVLYVRSAYRNDPEFQIGQLRSSGDPLEEVRVNRMIDNDAAVSRNYQKLASEGLVDLYDRGEETTTFGQYRHESIGDIQSALRKLFPNLILNSLGNPLMDGTFRFTKGSSDGFAYKNLSGGEKAAFDLILDLVVAKRDYDDTIFCIDEPESHMNMRLQAQLLSVLYDLVPQNCQLVLATHSIGMMRRARDIEADDPGSVVFLDFGDVDFDVHQVIEPIRPSREFWTRAYDVALDDLATLLAPKRVVICEGHPKTRDPVRNHSHDARCYEAIFETEFPEARFVSMGSDREIMRDRWGLGEALSILFRDLEVIRLVDRDDRTASEIADLAKDGVRVLSRRNLESYLFDDEVLARLAESAGRPDKVDELLGKKKGLLNSTSGVLSDDLKPIRRDIRVLCKNVLGLVQHGNTTEAFMRDTLAPLVRSDMTVYQDLKRDIFG